MDIPHGNHTRKSGPPAKEEEYQSMKHTYMFSATCPCWDVAIPAPFLPANLCSFKMCAILLMCSTMTTPTTRRITSTVLVVLVVLARRVPPSPSLPLTVSS